MDTTQALELAGLALAGTAILVGYFRYALKVTTTQKENKS